MSRDERDDKAARASGRRSGAVSPRCSARAGAHLPSEPGGGAPGRHPLVPIEAIRPSPFQPRRHFAEEELEGLAQSIREQGDRAAAAGAPGGRRTRREWKPAEYELVAGERRWRAAQRVGLHEVPIVVRALSNSEVIEIALVENLQRAGSVGA